MQNGDIRRCPKQTRHILLAPKPGANLRFAVPKCEKQKKKHHMQAPELAAAIPVGFAHVCDRYRLVRFRCIGALIAPDVCSSIMYSVLCAYVGLSGCFRHAPYWSAIVQWVDNKFVLESRHTVVKKWSRAFHALSSSSPPIRGCFICPRLRSTHALLRIMDDNLLTAVTHRG